MCFCKMLGTAKLEGVYPLLYQVSPVNTFMLIKYLISFDVQNCVVTKPNDKFGYFTFSVLLVQISTACCVTVSLEVRPEIHNI